MDYTIALILAAGVLLGWGAGGNDAANAVGTAIGARTVSYRKGIALVIVFSILGFLLQGEAVSKTVGDGIIPKSLFNLSWIVVLAVLGSAALITFLSVILSLPISINHTMVGSVLGVGLAAGFADEINQGLLYNILGAWISTPVIALVGTIIVHKMIVTPIAGRMDIVSFSRAFKFLSILGVAVVSYSLGASAISTVTGPLENSSILQEIPLIQGLLGVAIAFIFGLGVVTFSGRVIKTLGSKIALLGPSTAFSAQISAALTVYMFILMGLPASITHAIVGGIAAVGLMKGTRTLNKRMLGTILLGWILTPIASGLLAIGFYNTLL